MPKSVPWEVYLHGERFDTVYFPPDFYTLEVRDALIKDDKYPPEITVKRVTCPDMIKTQILS